MKGDVVEFKFNTKKTVLSSKGLFYKTENFINATKYISNIDMILTKLSEGILLNLGRILHNEKMQINDIECFKVSTKDELFVVYFKFGFQIDEQLNSYDLVFFESAIDNAGNRETVDRYLQSVAVLDIIVVKDKKLVKSIDFRKLYF